MRDLLMTEKRPMAVLISVVLLTLALSSHPGCSADQSSGVQQLDLLPQSSPANCLTILREAYIGRDYDRYRALFSDNFLFMFNPADVTNPSYPTPAQWELSVDLTSTLRMFGSGLVDRVELGWSPDEPVQSEGEYPGTWKVVCRQVSLRVHTRLADGSPFIYMVPDATETFYFVQSDGERASDGSPLWRIVRWEDRGVVGKAGSLPTEETTWGQIKARFLR